MKSWPINIRRLYIVGSSANSVKITKKTFGKQTITPFQLTKFTVRIFSREPHGSEMYEIPCCAVLQLLPLMFTPQLAWIPPPLGLDLTQLLPAAPLQMGAWLSYTTPGELPLSCSISPCVPSGWRKMHSLLGCCCYRHLNSNHLSFLLRPQHFGWPHDWKPVCG